MTELDLNRQETEQLMEVLEKVRNSKAYQNYLAGIRVNSKRAATLKGEGDVFARIGETLRGDKIPQFLNATAKGQKKVDAALQAELKQRELHRLLKSEPLNDAVYRELYIEPGTIGPFLGIVPQEKNMSDNEQNNTDNANSELFDRPEYDSEFYESDAVKNLNLGEKITAEDKKKLDALFDEYKKTQTNGGETSQGAEAETDENGEAGDGEADPDETREEDEEQGNTGAEGEQNGAEAMEINDMKGKTPRTAETQDAEWVKKYHAALTKWGQENNNAWTRDDQADQEGNRPAGLKGNFADGTEVHYTAEDKLSVKAPNGQEISAEHFQAVIALAKENQQDVKLGTTVSPAFKTALITACARGGVVMQGLSEEDRQLYDSLRQTPEQPKQSEIRAAEVKDTDEKGNPLYKANPKIAEGWMTMYGARAKRKGFEQEIATYEKQLAGGAYKVTGEEKARAQLLMMKYALAMENKDKAQADLCVTALQRYGVDTITRTPETDGKDKMTVKPYAERTEEEKTKIDQATEKLLPKKAREYDPTVMQIMKEKQGQTIN